MSQRAFARLAGFSKWVVVSIETDLYGPSEKTARLLAAATGVELREVCRMAEMAPPEQWVSERLTQSALQRAYVDQRQRASAVASDLGVSRQSVLNYLRGYGLPVREPGELRRRYTLCNAGPFAEPQTDWHAYWLGFLAADGCVFTANGRYLVRLRLKRSDEDHVRNFAQGTGSDAPVTTRDGYVQVEYFDKELVAALAKWEIIPNKTLAIAFPAELPTHLQPAFVRGYFDGDGSIYWRSRGGWRDATCKFVSGSAPMIDGLRATLTRAGIATGKVSPGSGQAIVLPILAARPNLCRFAEYLYMDATVWLPRKRTVFEQLTVRT